MQDSVIGVDLRSVGLSGCVKSYSGVPVTEEWGRYLKVNLSTMYASAP